MSFPSSWTALDFKHRQSKVATHPESHFPPFSQSAGRDDRSWQIACPKLLDTGTGASQSDCHRGSIARRDRMGSRWSFCGDWWSSIGRRAWPACMCGIYIQFVNEDGKKKVVCWPSSAHMSRYLVSKDAWVQMRPCLNEFEEHGDRAAPVYKVSHYLYIRHDMRISNIIHINKSKNLLAIPFNLP